MQSEKKSKHRENKILNTRIKHLVVDCLEVKIKQNQMSINSKEV